MIEEILPTGWLPDCPDWRDWDALSLIVKTAGDNKSKTAPKTTALPSKFDARKYCSPIENQSPLGSCTAQAVVGMAEYLERRLYGRHIDASRLFVYKMARQLDGFVGDTGSHIRTAMKALRLFGAPPERYWPYVASQFDVDPPAFVFGYGQNLQALNYYRIDTAGRNRGECLELIKRLVTVYFPSVLGFSVYSSGNEHGEFPMPEPRQRRRGGHAVMVCGYDDERVITRTKGALMIRNSWGTGWGAQGYGWLPYEYVTKHLSSDFWVLFQKETVT